MGKPVLAKVATGTLFLLGVIFHQGCKEQEDRIYPEKTAITESVYSSVTVQPDSLYMAYASVGGILDRNLVEEGSVVSKGDPIAQIINSTPNLNRENARLALELAEQNYLGNHAVLKSLREQIEAAALQYSNDSVNFARQKKLWDQGIGSRAEFDSRKLAFELSHNNLSLKKSSYAQMKNELETRYRQAQNSYETSRIAARDFLIESKINGTVYALYKNPGEIVTSMEPVASIGSTTDFLVEMLVDEVDIVKLKPGQKALISLDAYPSKVFEAQVSKIYPKKDERSQTFKVEALFRQPPPTLFPGLSGEGNIIIDQREDALVIPKEYLLNDSIVETEKGPVIVRTGLQDLERIEITSGIDTGTLLLKPEK
ncbi:Multidrug efflux pump subunit AcrA (membrane-fusion protein) [Muriicola jejuensis]|uniref:HlyD family efflux transporter periplasmic adaptor subunit n=1 Tax=Muriicola jejuensis TaxID=504488 RepID=A0A6P0UG62_9FLAO|nr:HlyD family efflux transporter periplasmic adaptor subunit [Muriicola jejuensis]NER09106.1 HlyD family efflux transporter periplasmic adaptor subunit [Muriicola jejuensis]SMP11088.1 Multidrug efflux pump subunit AcrA (membrane-fusion protein) [Muriicola jejuensis]